MNQSEFKRIARLLKKVYEEIDMETLASTRSLDSAEYDLMIATAREAVLKKFGFSLKEYQDAKAEAEKIRLGERPSFEEIKAAMETMKTLPVLTKEQVTEIAQEAAKAHVKPPQIINKIVREVIIKEPQIIKETVVEKTVQEIAYNEIPLQEKISAVSKRVDDIKIPQSIDFEKFREELAESQQASLKESIEILNMPNFRKLGLGLKDDIDKLYRLQITVSSTAPVNPYVNQLWYDIS